MNRSFRSPCVFEDREHPRLIRVAVERLLDQALQFRDIGQDDGGLGRIVAVHRLDPAEKVFDVVSGELR